MERAQLPSSRSAPDLTDLLEARSFDKRRMNGVSDDDAPDEADDDEDEDDDMATRWRSNQLPTPEASRSPSPDLDQRNGRNYGHSTEDADTYSYRLGSEPPEPYQRGEYVAMRRPTFGTRITTGQSYRHELAESQTQSETEPAVNDRSPEDSVDPDSPTSPTEPHVLSNIGARFLPASLWDYLQQEISASELDGSQEMKAERVTNFFAVPMAIEQIIIFGYFVCLDSFLYTFTILPLRFAIALRRWVASYFKPGKRKSLPVAAKCDLAKFSIFIVTCFTLHHITDASKMYHSVRGQEVIKLYVIFNVLETLLFFWSGSAGFTLFTSDTGAPRGWLTAAHTSSRTVHDVCHLYDLVSLNVAINSYDNALLTLLLSNQFVEIKGAVFKKFEKENLFQMSCADIVERFQLSLMLCIIAMRNLVELNGSTFSLLPTSFIPVMPSMTILQSIFSPVLIVILSEMFVDWLKHAFITKFNHIRPAVYGRFIDILCKDLVMGNPTSATSPFADHSPTLARRLGFAALPVGCLIVRVIFQTIEMLADTSHIDECAPPRKMAVGRGLLSYISIGPEGQARIFSWLVYLLIGFILWSCLVIMKLLIGINLRAYALSRYAGMQERAAEDQRNDRSRPNIGASAAEMVQEGDNKRLIEKKEYDSPGKFTGRVGVGNGQGVQMETLSRFSMVKSRIY